MIAEKTEVKIPTINVVANDSISPVPKTFKIIATNKCVMFASIIEGNAFTKPVETDDSVE